AGGRADVETRRPAVEPAPVAWRHPLTGVLADHPGEIDRDAPGARLGGHVHRGHGIEADAYAAPGRPHAVLTGREARPVDPDRAPAGAGLHRLRLPAEGDPPAGGLQVDADRPAEHVDAAPGRAGLHLALALAGDVDPPAGGLEGDGAGQPAGAQAAPGSREGD